MKHVAGGMLRRPLSGLLALSPSGRFSVTLTFVILLPVALLAGLVVTQTAGGDDGIVIDDEDSQGTQGVARHKRLRPVTT